jgi:hypothetical protein
LIRFSLYLKISPRSAGEEEEDGDDGAEDAVAPTSAPATAQQDGTPAAAGTLRPQSILQMSSKKIN